MARNVTRHLRDDRQKNLVRIFNEACYRHTRWRVWADFVEMAAIEISNAVDKSNAPGRSSAYKSLASSYNQRELDCFGRMLAEIVNGIDECPDQDFLGELYMALELGNEHAGQFFTPYSVCRAMASITGSDIKARVERDHWVSVNDPACGAGALLVAFANECLRQGVNYQTDVLFVAQDVDLVVGCMCYLQMSLLGCPGYVVIANTLTNPVTSIDGKALIPVHGENIWYTPMYFRDVWHWRRVWWQMDHLIGTTRPKLDSAPPAAVPEPETTPLNETKAGQLTLF